MLGFGKAKTIGYEVKVIMGDLYDNKLLLKRAEARIERLTAKLDRCHRSDLKREIELDIKRWKVQKDLAILILNVEERGIKG